MRYSILNATVQQVQAVGGTDIKEAPSIKVIFAELTEAQVAMLKAQGCSVSEIKPIKVRVAPPTPVQAQPIYSGIDLIGIVGFDKVRTLTTPPLYGDGVNVAVIGTGIRETHQLINNRVVFSKNYTTSPDGDGFNHDTGVCSLLLAVAPNCSVLNLKVMDDNGNGTEEEVVMAIDDCISFQTTKPSIAPSVINMSFGTQDSGDPNDIMRVACRAAIANGIWCVAAAGNSGPEAETIVMPACEDTVFAIGSCGLIPTSGGGYNFVISDFSSRGPTLGGLTKPDAVFVGENIIMASSSGDTDTIAKSGTSFSTPFFTGMCALFFEGFEVVTQYQGQPVSGYYPSIPNVPTPDVMIDKVLGSVCVGAQGSTQAKDDDYGYGMPYGDLAVEAFQQMAGASTTSLAGVDVNSLVGIVMLIGMMGIMTKVISKTAGKTKARISREKQWTY